MSNTPYLKELLSPACTFCPRIFTVRNSSCRKVMFSQACVKNSVHRGGHTPWRDRQTDRQTETHPGQTPPGQTHTCLLDRHIPLGRHTTLDIHTAPLDRHTPLDRHPPGQTPAPPPEMTTAADGTHPAGMHSSSKYILG